MGTSPPVGPEDVEGTYSDEYMQFSSQFTDMQVRLSAFWQLQAEAGFGLVLLVSLRSTPIAKWNSLRLLFVTSRDCLAAHLVRAAPLTAAVC